MRCALALSVVLHLCALLALRHPVVAVTTDPVEPVYVLALGKLQAAKSAAKSLFRTADGPAPQAPLTQAAPVMNAVDPREVVRKGNQLPQYPPVAVQSGWEGTVVLGLQIDGGGKVQRARVLESSGYWVLDESALVAARMWKLAGYAGDITVPIVFEFE